MTIYLQNYSHFSDKFEMDIATKQHLSDNWNNLNDTVRSVLDLIRQYSVKYGSAHLKHKTISNRLKKSVSTIRRAIVKLEQLRIVERVKFIRPKLSGLGANVYAILPIGKQNEQRDLNNRTETSKPTGSKEETSKLENEPLFLKSLSSRDTEDTVKRGLRDKIPAFIYDLMSPYLNENDMREAYGRLLRAKSSVDNTILFEEDENLFSDAIASVFNAYKRGKVRSLLAVLYTAIRDTSMQIWRIKNHKITDWLND